MLYLKLCNRTGEDNKPAGKYKEVGPRGGKVNDPRIVNIDKGDRLPPTSESGNNWKKIK
ncbi:YjzC family protein [Enterococcus faecium]|nr:YjzC family protein [Enterococcus faecium]